MDLETIYLCILAGAGGALAIIHIVWYWIHVTQLVPEAYKIYRVYCKVLRVYFMITAFTIGYYIAEGIIDHHKNKGDTPCQVIKD